MNKMHVLSNYFNYWPAGLQQIAKNFAPLGESRRSCFYSKRLKYFLLSQWMSGAGNPFKDFPRRSSFFRDR
jgi:hypothetical protein